MSSCSNSPSSVRVNLEKKGLVEEDGKEATNSEDDIDMLDAKTPLLKETHNTAVIVESGSSSNISSGNPGGGGGGGAIRKE